MAKHKEVGSSVREVCVCVRECIREVSMCVYMSPLVLFVFLCNAGAMSRSEHSVGLDIQHVTCPRGEVCGRIDKLHKAVVLLRPENGVFMLNVYCGTGRGRKQFKRFPRSFITVDDSIPRHGTTEAEMEKCPVCSITRGN